MQTLCILGYPKYDQWWCWSNCSNAIYYCFYRYAFLRVIVINGKGFVIHQNQSHVILSIFVPVSLVIKLVGNNKHMYIHTEQDIWFNWLFLRIMVCMYIQSNLNSSDTDSSFLMAYSYSFFVFLRNSSKSLRKKIFREAFLFYREIVCCVYSLESPHWGDSNEYIQHTVTV